MIHGRSIGSRHTVSKPFGWGWGQRAAVAPQPPSETAAVVSCRSMLNFMDQENAARQGDELVRRYGQNKAAKMVDAEVSAMPGNEYCEAVRARVVASVPQEERRGIMAPSLAFKDGVGRSWHQPLIRK